eukprot:1156509-Pelagomonas_calceolata.AAC.4
MDIRRRREVQAACPLTCTTSLGGGISLASENDTLSRCEVSGHQLLLRLEAEDAMAALSPNRVNTSVLQLLSTAQWQSSLLQQGSPAPQAPSTAPRRPRLLHNSAKGRKLAMLCAFWRYLLGANAQEDDCTGGEVAQIGG